jgi:hypothetical protein
MIIPALDGFSAGTTCLPDILIQMIGIFLTRLFYRGYFIAVGNLSFVSSRKFYETFIFIAVTFSISHM